MRTSLSLVVLSLAVILAVATSSPDEPAPTASQAPTAAPATPSTAAPSAARPLLDAHQAHGDDPVQALTLWLRGARLAGDQATNAAGEHVLTALTVDGVKDPDWLGRPSNATFHRRLTSHPHVFRSYFEGATPDNDYAAPASAPLRIADHHAQGDDAYVIELVSSGADSPRRVTLKRSKQDERWYVHRFANLYVDIRPPVDADAPF